MGEVSAVTQNESINSTTTTSRERCVSDSNVELQKNANRKKMNGTSKHGDTRRRHFGHAFGKRLRLILRPWKWRRKTKRSRYLGSASCSHKDVSLSDDDKATESETKVDCNASKLSYSTSDLSNLTPLDVKFTMDLDKPNVTTSKNNGNLHTDNSAVTSTDIVTIDKNTNTDTKINGDVPISTLSESPDASQRKNFKFNEVEMKPKMVEIDIEQTQSSDKVGSPPSVKTINEKEGRPPPPYPGSVTITKDIPPPPPSEIPTASRDNDDEEDTDHNDIKGSHDNDDDDAPPPPIPPRGASISYDGYYHPSHGSDDSEESSLSSRYNSDDEEESDNHVVTGLASKVKRTDSLALKLGARPSRQELEGKNIIHTQTDDEKQAIRSNIGSNLVRRLSQRPTKEELEQRNIYRSTTDEETHQKNFEETKRTLSRKLSRRPTIKELRKKKIIGFNEYVEVFEVQEYDRRADKPWTRLTPKDKASIRKELNEYKEFEMDVHEDSKKFTRFHRP